MERALIIEIGTEEVPARFIEGYANEFGSQVLQIISENRLSESKDFELYYTPRRVIFIKNDVKERQDDEEREVIGPPVRVCFGKDGRGEKALESFLERYGISSDNIFKKESPKGELVAARIHVRGQEAGDILRYVLPRAISSIKFKKSMRWGDNDLLFIRPIRWIVALLGSQIIPFEIAGVKASNRSYGNFNVDTEGFEVKDRDSFLRSLDKRYVVYDVSKRRDLIVSHLRRIFKEFDADEIIDKDLLLEVTNLLEYPVPIKGTFDERYLELPMELLEVVQRHHQRYFPVICKGKVLPAFIAFANNPVGDVDTIRAGMEKVLGARLNDAVFFYREDKRKGITEMADLLKLVMYQKGLGNYDKKAERLIRISEYLAERLSLSTDIKDKIRKAAFFAKADLVSLSVGEFPELQGIMGKYLALSAGLSEDIATAIEEHYKPVQSGSDLPAGVIGSVVAIADRIDHICGLFLTNQRPAASSDPYATRRAAQAIIDIIQAHKMQNIITSQLVEFVLSGFNIEEVTNNEGKSTINYQAKEEVVEFLRGRIKAQLSESMKPDVVEAILNAESGIEDISSIFERRDALSRFIEDAEFEKFAVVYKRASNITREFVDLQVDEGLFEFDEERELYKAFRGIEQRFYDCLLRRDYLSAMNLLKENLYKPVFDFFDRVFVMVEEENIRRNRLALLKNIVILFRKIIDLSYISSMKM